MYRTALVALKPGSSNEAACRYAIALAQRENLRLLGLSVIDPSRVISAEMMPPGGGAYKAMKDDALLHHARQAAGETLKDFSKRAETAGIAYEALETEGELDVTITTAVQRTDLLVVGHRAVQDIADVPASTEALGGILRHCPRPALVVPALPGATNRILVAYDGSPQAARAVQQFVASGLHQGRQVHLLSIHEDPVVAESVASLAVDYLGAYGIAMERYLEVPRANVAEQILQEAGDMGAELLVMGAYAQPALRKFFFGSTTRDILINAKIPVFLYH